MNIKKVTEYGYHIFDGDKSNTMLYRYGILKQDGNMEMDKLCRKNKNTIEFTSPKREVSAEYINEKTGWRLKIKLTPNEKLYGLGDSHRTELNLRGQRVQIRKQSVTGYGPMPILMSTDGWGLVLNTTYDNIFDCDSQNNGSLEIFVTDGNIDFYLFGGNNLREILEQITSVTGRPTVLPKYAYGMVFVENDHIDARSLLWDIKTMRDHNIPCDLFSLEPGWMSEYYDYSTKKDWDRKKFPEYSWHEKFGSDHTTFFYCMRKMGMKLSLWNCQEYDYFFYEDGNTDDDKIEEYSKDAIFIDPHLSKPVLMDKITKKSEPWFEHLKRFISNGVSAFKYDGARHGCPHPDRLWGGKYLDKEVNNFLPVILAKQTFNGFKEYTDTRLMLFCACSYIGSQQYTATWGGDTGCGPKVLVGTMNLAMCGHSNTTCDMEFTDLSYFHHCFFLPWTEYYCWAQWSYPWFLGDETENIIREYGNLRSSLFPYIYTMAHKAYMTGTPILRPLPLMFEDDERLSNVQNAYMFGDKLYVGVFDMNLSLPKGKWTDYFTGKVYEGDIEYKIPENKGGALFVKNGSIFVTMKPQKYILEKSHEYIINVYPGGDDSFALYEDDGLSFDYQDGKYAETLIEMTNSAENGFNLTVHTRKGSFEGKPDNGYDIHKNSIPEIKGMQPITDMPIVINGQIKTVMLDDNCIDFIYDKTTDKSTFILSKELHETKDVTYKITL